MSKTCSPFLGHPEFSIDHNELMHGQLKNSHNVFIGCAKMDDFLPTTTRKHIVHLITKQFLKSTACICSAITTWLVDRTLRSTTLSPQVSFNLPVTCSSLEIVQQEPTQAEICLQSCDKPTEPNTTCISRECRPTATPKLLIMATALPIYLCADGS